MPAFNVPEDREPLVAEEATEDQNVEEGTEKGTQEHGTQPRERRGSLRTERDREWLQNLHFATG